MNGWCCGVACFGRFCSRFGRLTPCFGRFDSRFSRLTRCFGRFDCHFSRFPIIIGKTVSGLLTVFPIIYLAFVLTFLACRLSFYRGYTLF